MKLSKAYSQYGASMGRPSDGPLVGRVHLERVYLDRGGYDNGGVYWGAGEPLYRAMGHWDGVTYLRASSREEAKSKLVNNRTSWGGVPYAPLSFFR